MINNVLVGKTPLLLLSKKPIQLVTKYLVEWLFW